MARVDFVGVTRSYPQMDRPAVDHLDLTIEDGELMVLVGPSGCGKSTALRMLAGLEPVDAGRILLDGVDVTSSAARDRDIAMVFQTYALYPHMTVAENIAFHLVLDGVGRDEVRRRVDDVAEMLNITELLAKKPSTLSGGQRQRVAMGRALIRRPRVFLMDEPLSNLDAKLRMRMRTEIASLQKRLGTTTLYVTHDQVEAMTLGDRVAVQRDGVLVQCAPPMELYERPVDTFVAGFIGSPAMNLLPARVCGGHARACGFDHELTPRQSAELVTDRVVLGIRPESFTLSAAEGIPSRVEIVETLGADTIVFCSAPHTAHLAVRLPRGRVAVGESIRLAPRVGEVHVFDPVTTKRLEP